MILTGDKINIFIVEKLSKCYNFFYALCLLVIKSQNYVSYENNQKYILLSVQYFIAVKHQDMSEKYLIASLTYYS